MTDEQHAFLLQRVQPAMVGLIDGSLSTLAPIFAIALHTHKPFDAFIAGVGTFIGGILHTLPFLIPTYHVALLAAIIVVGFELIVLAYLRYRFFGTSFIRSFASVTLGGVAIAVVSA